LLDGAGHLGDRGVNLLIGALTIGLLLSLLALGVFITYRVFGILDVTTDGSFGVGAATAAALLAQGWPPAAATAVGAGAGMTAGLVTGLVHTRFGVNALLAGILTTTALYSGNLYIMGGGDRSVAAVPTLITQAEGLFTRLVPNAEAITLLGTPVSARNLASLALLVLVVAAVTGLLARFFGTNLGLALRATGDNPQMARALGVSVSGMIVVGLVMANGLIGLAGALFAEYQGFANIQMGLGIIVTGLASVVLGEALAGGRQRVTSRLATVVLGAVLFRLVIAGALRAGLDPNALKLVTAVFLLLALVVPGAVRRRLHLGLLPGDAHG
jgi:putative tryptophan/tyrosine transport system permease protein